MNEITTQDNTPAGWVDRGTVVLLGRTYTMDPAVKPACIPGHVLVAVRSDGAIATVNGRTESFRGTDRADSRRLAMVWATAEVDRIAKAREVAA